MLLPTGPPLPRCYGTSPLLPQTQLVSLSAIKASTAVSGGQYSRWRRAGGRTEGECLQARSNPSLLRQRLKAAQTREQVQKAHAGGPGRQSPSAPARCACACVGCSGCAASRLQGNVPCGRHGAKCMRPCFHSRAIHQQHFSGSACSSAAGRQVAATALAIVKSTDRMPRTISRESRGRPACSLAPIPPLPPEPRPRATNIGFALQPSTNTPPLSQLRQDLMLVCST